MTTCPYGCKEYGLLQAALDQAELRATEAEIMLEAAKAFVWYAEGAASKMNSLGKITPHAEIEWFRALRPQMNLWLERVGQIGIDFKKAHAAIDAALAERKEK